MQKIIRQIAAEIRVTPAQVQAAVELLDSGATVPFIARYRKEATNGLDDIQLRELEARLSYLRELADRRVAILKAIDEQGKLTDALRLPFKQKRRTKGQMAREAGIEPLADKLFADPTLDPNAEAAAFTRPAEVLDDGKIGADFSTVPAVLDGVRDILSERWAEDAALVQHLREWLWAEGLLRSKKVDGKNENDPEVSKFRDYFDYDEPMAASPCTWAGATKAAPPTTCCASASPGPGASSSVCPLNATCSRACAKTRKKSPSKSLPTTCATCCWPPRPARAW